MLGVMLSRKLEQTILPHNEKSIEEETYNDVNKRNDDEIPDLNKQIIICIGLVTKGKNLGQWQ
jgi:hypothetical protein